MKEILNRLNEYQTLSKQEAKTVLLNISKGSYNGSQIASFVTVYRMRGITIDELAGFRNALNEMSIHIDMNEFNTIDLCGTGGDSKNTFNISTLASLVVAGAGEKVTKHGNYGVSSACGSSNVMEYFGYVFTNKEDVLKIQLDKAGICFFHAPLFHPAMKAVAPIRKELGVKTFFNLLGPMINPSFPSNQLIGVFDLEALRLYNYIYQQLDLNFIILHSLDGYDEISLTGAFKIMGNNRESILEPEDIGLSRVLPEELHGGTTVKEAAGLFRNILEGNGTETQNQVVLANAGMALQCMHPGYSFIECFEIAENSLLKGHAKNALEKAIELSK